MRTHHLKTWPSQFDAVRDGRKTFEYRLNDRDYALGDTLVLRKWSPDGRCVSGASFGCYLSPIGVQTPYATDADAITVEVTHIVYGGQFGIPVNYCCMSIQKAEVME